MPDYQLPFTGPEIENELYRIVQRILSDNLDDASLDSEIASAKAIYDAMPHQKNEVGTLYVGSAIRFCFFNSVICVETLENGVWTQRNLLGHHINAPNIEISKGFTAIQQTSKNASFQTVQDVFNLIEPDVDGMSQTYGDYRKTTILVGSEVDPDSDVKISKFEPSIQLEFGTTVTTIPVVSPYIIGDEEPILKGKYSHDIPIDITGNLIDNQVGLVWKFVGWYDNVAGGDQDNGSAYTYDVSLPFGDETGLGLGENETYGSIGFENYTDFSWDVLHHRCVEENKTYNSLEEYKHLNGGGFTTQQGTLESTIIGGVPTAQWNQQHKLYKDKLYIARIVTDTAYTLNGDGTFPKIEAVLLPYRYETIATREEIDYVTIKNIDDLSSIQSIAVINTYQDVNYTTEAFLNSSKFSVVNGVITYDGVKDILLKVDFAVSVGTDINNTVLTIALYKNGVEDKGVRASRKLASTTDTGSVGIASSINVSTGDVIKWVIKSDKIANITFDNIQSTITKIVDL